VKTAKLAIQWGFTMVVALGVAIGLGVIWAVCSVGIMIEDINR